MPDLKLNAYFKKQLGYALIEYMQVHAHLWER